MRGGGLARSRRRPREGRAALPPERDLVDGGRASAGPDTGARTLEAGDAGCAPTVHGEDHAQVQRDEAGRDAGLVTRVMPMFFTFAMSSADDR